MSRMPLIAGNWKMNILPSETASFVAGLSKQIKTDQVEVLICPPFTHLAQTAYALKDSNIKLGAQNLYWEQMGAYTGEISPLFLKDIGCKYVIIGHSERRQYFGETNLTVQKRIVAAQKNGLVPVVCVGETLAEREAQKTFDVIEKQLSEALVSVDPQNLVIAYEPVWAIGTGKTASNQQANEVHVFIRGQLKKIFDASVADGLRILYGGSVKPENIKGLMSESDIDGALVGGASLKIEDFAAIVNY